MLTLRFIPPLLFAIALLFAQQGGALHTLRHVFAEQTQQQNKQAPHAKDCEQCTTYAQLASALDSESLSFGLHPSFSQTLAQHHFLFFTRHTLPAVARGPPVFQRSI